jgi:hypothetical protein
MATSSDEARLYEVDVYIFDEDDSSAARRILTGEQLARARCTEWDVVAVVDEATLRKLRGARLSMSAAPATPVANPRTAAYFREHPLAGPRSSAARRRAARRPRLFFARRSRGASSTGSDTEIGFAATSHLP